METIEVLPLDGEYRFAKSALKSPSDFWTRICNEILQQRLTLPSIIKLMNMNIKTISLMKSLIWEENPTRSSWDEQNTCTSSPSFSTEIGEIAI